jgi:hypothetical protein
MKKYPEYEIKNLLDFLRVPEDKICKCLLDFEVWCAVARVGQKMGATVMGRFVWIDDGKQNAHINIQVTGEEAKK